MAAKKKAKGPSKKSRGESFDYKSATKTLNSFGWKVSAKTKRQKEKVRELWKQKSAYINYTKQDRVVSPIIGVRKLTKAQRKKKGKVTIAKTSKLSYRFKFQKLSKKEMRQAKASKLFSSAQYTPNGIFLERPKGIPDKKYKVRFKKGAVEINSDCRNDEILLLDSAQLAIDPQRTIQEAIANRGCLDGKGRQKPIKSYSLMVNGFRAQTSSNLSEKSFIWYLTNKLLPEWLEKQDEGSEADFTDTFHIRLIY